MVSRLYTTSKAPSGSSHVVMSAISKDTYGKAPRTTTDDASLRMIVKGVG